KAGLEFEALLLRIHPAASRVKMLAQESPASYVAFGLLGRGEDDLRERRLAERREMLERALGKARAPVHLTPASADRAVAQDWFSRFEGAGLDGVVAKELGSTYQPGKRAMVKVKHARTADCVVAGFRWHKNGPGTLIGSLLLGLYDDEGTLHHVGIASSFTMARRRELVEELAPGQGPALLPLRPAGRSPRSGAVPDFRRAVGRTLAGSGDTIRNSTCQLVPERDAAR